MLASDLPFELLSKITALLLPKDKLSCALTCKNWRTPYQESLWSNIQVNSFPRLEYMCATSNILNVFHNVEDFDMGFLSLYRTDLQKANYILPQWKPVTSLKLKLKPRDWYISAHLILEISRVFPNVRAIDISLCCHNSIEFKLDHYNYFHIALPNLTNIKAFLLLDFIHPDEVPSIPRTRPALDVTSLSFDLIILNHTWIYYFIYKYPNLRTLTWKAAYQENLDSTIEYDERKASLIRSVEKAFLHLETLDFCISEPTEWAHALLWDLLCPLSVPIKDLKYKINSSDCGVPFLEMVIERLVQSFSTTLKTLSVVGSVYTNGEPIYKPDFLYCPHLVSVEINECGVSIALDSLLDSCPALRKLSFSSGQLYISEDPQEKPSLHGLEILILDNIVTNVSVLNYTSFRCRTLQLETRSLCIDMSCTNFKLLKLEQVSFYSSKEDMSKDTTINLMLISQLTGSRMSTETKDNLEPSVEHLAWYHISGEYTEIFDSTLETRQLLEQETYTTNEYFQVSQFKDRPIFSKPEKSFDEQINKEDLEEDLCRGYVELRCGQIAEYIVPSLCFDYIKSIRSFKEFSSLEYLGNCGSCLLNCLNGGNLSTP
ncbi:hypothetical protein J3Q64DRAFT_1822635 [Phycomyces blakesleeanus]|uniref:F-box domain-containing protein n=1 Tax=Phycomyces blakesleeanus TaxID=4837 RepID=A0ABR3AWY2_PHYBL